MTTPDTITRLREMMRTDHPGLTAELYAQLPALLDRLEKLERAFALARVMNAADISQGHAMGCAYDGPRSKCDCEWVEYIHAQHDFAALANGEDP